MTIEHRDKIGIGLWDVDAKGTALNDVDRAGFAWHYTWRAKSLWDVDATPEMSTFVPMIWGESYLTADAISRIRDSGATTLLGFNEPDHAKQSNMSVTRALELWPQLEATGLRLGSPAVTQTGALGETSWLGQFMAGAEAQGLQVDFIQVHYYSKTADVAAFRTFLEAVHQQYGKPIWVTEWCLADWANPSRFSADQQAAYARAATEMMDDLPFVEKQAWFAGYEGGDGWNLNSGVFTSTGDLSAVGQAFLDLNAGTPEILGTSGADVLVGTADSELLLGEDGDDRLGGGGGDDTLRAGAGHDLLDGGAGRDRLEGGQGDDAYVVSDTLDTIVELAGEGRDEVRSSVTFTLGQDVEDLVLTGTARVNATGNALDNRVVGNAGINVLDGAAGADRLEGMGSNDIYRVDHSGDVAIELAGQGFDRVQASVGHTLAANVEELLLLGTSDLAGTANALANRVTGNAGANVLDGLGGSDKLYGVAGDDLLLGGAGHDTLDGGTGHDVLLGGAGNDSFVFNGGQDRVADFTDNLDTLQLDDALWSGTALTLSEVLALAAHADGAIVFDFANGHLLRVEGVATIASLMDDLAIV
ncbi:glycosyl hydrolase [Rubellimicrobium roseum]|uniref:Asl1-like glycosyl hydrolase catalytic domain-containing protein n=1 Tax=Rubellimicrobium roseum TaxID=687525 RepID=A0A5C4NE17_9RHOB|nr:glycosyl hydrolase [Rubellimicrobium roseum]TNC71396.1 hypothetical protein FHG71_11620 [Rubellimicrobium roseum]